LKGFIIMKLAAKKRKKIIAKSPTPPLPAANGGGIFGGVTPKYKNMD
jgi:hypothetical protein